MTNFDNGYDIEFHILSNLKDLHKVAIGYDKRTRKKSKLKEQYILFAIFQADYTRTWIVQHTEYCFPCFEEITFKEAKKYYMNADEADMAFEIFFSPTAHERVKVDDNSM